MIEMNQQRIAAGQRAYVYLALVPICSLVGWVLIVFLRPHLNESLLYRALDSSIYLAVAGVVVLMAISIRFRRSTNFVRLMTMSLFCGLVLALVIFVGYMTVGFG